MSELRPCPECKRHIRLAETTCPFCEATITERATPRKLPLGRLTRAAVFAGALGTAAAATACGPAKSAEGPQNKPMQTTPDAQMPPPPPEGVADAGAEPPPPPPADAAAPIKREPPDHPIPKPYGAPPVRHRIV